MTSTGTSVVDFAWNPLPCGGFALYDLDVEQSRGLCDPLRLHLVRRRLPSGRVQWALLWWAGPQDGAGVWFTLDRNRSEGAESRYAADPVERVARGQWGSKEQARRLAGVR